MRRALVAVSVVVLLAVIAALAWWARPAPPPDVSPILADRVPLPKDHARRLPPRVSGRKCRLDQEARAALLELDKARSLDDAEPALGALLDAGACDRIGYVPGRVPVATAQRWFDAAIDTLRQQGNRAGAARWETDALALAPDLGRIGRIEVALAALDLMQDLGPKLGEDLAFASAEDASRAAELAAWAHGEPGFLSHAIDLDLTQVSKERWPDAELAAHADEANALEAERRLWMAFVDGGGPPPPSAVYVDGPALITARENLREIERRLRALVVLGAAVASRPDPTHCLEQIDAMRAAVPKEVLTPKLPLEDLSWDPARCTISILEPDGSVAERYSAIEER